MVSSQVLLVLAVLPIVAYCYTCRLEDSSAYVQYNECSTSTFCTVITEYDNNNKEVKKRRGCDNGACTTNGNFNTNKNYDGSWSNVNCCTGNYCNSATNKGLLALPLMMITYFLAK